ncbi:MAG: hypothetical protein KDI55_28875, partial [Anaerolineae bacterium]|nr:hypothetical protein [Anaerolineae bacterium]
MAQVDFSSIFGFLIIISAGIYASLSKKLGGASSSEATLLINFGIGFVMLAFALSYIRIWLFPLGYTFSDVVLL